MNTNPMDWPLMIAALLPWASIAVAALITPRLTRPDLFFSVTVNPSFRVSPAGCEILRKYTRLVVIVALLALLPVGFVKFSPSLVMVGLLGPMLVEMAGCFGAFLVARRSTIPYHVEPTAQREAELAPRRFSLPGGWIAQAGPFLILGVVCVCLWTRWDQIPARVPIHWGAHGNPDGWAAKSPASIFGGAAIGGLTCLLIGGLLCAMVAGVRRIHSSGGAGRREARFVRGMLYFLLGVEYWIALLMGFFSLAAIRRNPEAPLPAFLPIVLGQTVIIGTILVVAYRMGQGGWRADGAGENEAPDSNAPPVGDRTPDECWKLGVFYFNRNDSAFLVEKRFGVGWTFNFANPRSWIFMAALLLFMAASLGLAFAMKRPHP